MKRKYKLLPLIVVWMLSSVQAKSCPVCFASNDETRGAFLLTTALLSLMPLILFALVVFWFRSHRGELNCVQEEFNDE